MKRNIIILCILCIMCAFTMLCTNIQKKNNKVEKSSNNQLITSTESTTQQSTTTGTPPTTEPVKQVPTCLTINIPLSEDLKKFIYEKCDHDERLYCLVIAMIERESDFQADVIGLDGHDYGLMQIRDCNHQWLQEKLGPKDFLNPYDNVECGIYIIKQYWNKYQYENLALMCYNMGENNAQSMWNEGIYSTEYTVAILSKYEKYKEQVYN